MNIITQTIHPDIISEIVDALNLEQDEVRRICADPNYPKFLSYLKNRPEEGTELINDQPWNVGYFSVFKGDEKYRNYHPHGIIMNYHDELKYAEDGITVVKFDSMMSLKDPSDSEIFWISWRECKF